PVKRTRTRYFDDSNIPIPKRTQMRRRCKTSLECDRDSQTDTEESDALSEMETAAEIEFETNLLVHALDAGPLMVADEQHQEPRPPLDVDSHDSDDTNSHNLSGEACKDILNLMKQLHPDSSSLKDINYATLWSIAGIWDHVQQSKKETMERMRMDGSHPVEDITDGTSYQQLFEEEPGVVVRQGKGHARCYPHRKDSGRLPTRLQEEVLTAMHTATPRARVQGFKESGKRYFVGKELKTISARLSHIQPPYFIERLPRDLEVHHNHLKATEYQSWLLFYALPCMD
ncbi:hypothetical protein KUCAC02_010118, partial [Chaenocephalus aceratus]